MAVNKDVAEKLYALLRAAMDGGAFDEALTDDAWRWLYREAARQSLLGVCWVPTDAMPKDLALQWAAEAESIRGLNLLLNDEAARLTRLFADEGRKTAVLKGQANARLYPDKLSRQPGDIDLWVEGGYKSVVELLNDMKLIDGIGTTASEGKATASYHHVHIPANEKGVVVEIHFRPASGNYNPITNRRLQRWLEQEIPQVTMVEEGFNVPTIKFALMMQLAHIQRHFLAGGIGLRHVCDYYLLLQQSTAEDRETIAPLLKKLGLAQTAGALMWVLAEVLRLDDARMIAPKDDYRGQWMLREIMAGGNFGRYSGRRQQNVFRRVWAGRVRNLKMMRFDFWEMLWVELNFWKVVVQTLPERIRRRSWSLAEANKRDGIG